MRREKFLVNFCCCSGNLKSLFFVCLDLTSWTPSQSFFAFFLTGVFRNIRNTSLSIREVTVLYTQVPVSPFGNLCPIIDKREILTLYSCW